ncbi:MAG TPA: ferritin-like domain-containing protein [Planctomycetales bacterium]|jgi:ferritin-like metal-binding protein YciE|nr:ferritin-like domain-containing protein [Planctomycetales bacterium]
MKLATLEDLLHDHLKDLYSAENQLVKALPKMAKAASAPALRAGFTEHLAQTRVHVERLEQICKQMGVKPKGKKCAAMEGLLEEGKEMMEEDAAPAVMDAGLIAAAQSVEHYEMAGYGCVRTWAEQLGHRAEAAILQQTYQEEKACDEKLSQLAKQTVNQKAEQGNGAVPKKTAAKSRAK